MPIRDTLARWLTGEPELKASVIGLEDGQLPDSPLEKAWDDAALISTLTDDPWPYFCIAKVAENAALAPLQFGLVDEDGEFEWVGPEHPVQSLWDSPNTTDDGAGLTQMLFTYLEAVGHAPIEVVRPTRGYGRITPGNRAGFELYAVNPGPWRIVAKPDASIAGFVYLGTTDYRWSTDEMTYLRWPNPSNRWYGQGRLAAVRNEIMAEEYATQRDKGFEKRLGVPPGILTSKMPLGEPTALELQRRWEKAVGGYRNAGRIAVLGSETTYQAISATARDAQWAEQRRARQDTIAMAVGVPPVLLRMSEATFANAEQARAELWEGTLQPRMSRVAAMITRRLVPMLTDEPLVARFDYADIKALNENEAEVVDIALKMSNTAVATVGEVRARIGLEPFDDERDEAVLLPSNVEWSTDREASRAQAAEMAAALRERTTVPDTEDEDEPTEEETPADEAEDAAERMPQRRAFRPVRVVRRKARRQDRDTLLAAVRAAYMADLGAYFAALRGALRPVAKANSEPEEEAERIINEPRWRARIERISRGPIETSLAMGAIEAAGLLSVDPSFLVDANEYALQAVLARTTNLPNVLNTTTVTDVQAAIRGVLETNGGRNEMNQALDELFEGYQQWRLDRIARTETAYAYAQGSVGQMREAGVAMVHITDGDGDDECRNWNDRTVSLDEYLADPLGHPNCTRDAEPVFADEVAGAEQIAASGPVSEMTKNEVIATALRVAADLAAPPPPAPVPMRTVIDRDPETGTIVGAHEEVA